MSGNFIRVEVRNENGPRKLITSVQRETIPAATEAAANYLVGNEQRGLRHLSPYRYVSRMSAYGQSFFSEKQRRYVMAMISKGIIKPGVSNRTGKISAGWRTEGRGLIVQVINRADGVGYVQGDTSQSRHEAKVGHRKVSVVIASLRVAMIQAAQQAVNRVLKGGRQ